MFPKEIPLEESYAEAFRYVESLHEAVIRRAFLKTSEEEWSDAVQDYLLHPHKGSNGEIVL